MRIGFFAVGIGDLARPELIRTVAVNAERLGFATVWAPEHAVLFDSFASRYPYSIDGKLPIAADTIMLNPFLALTYAAAHSSRIRLATGISIVPLSHPLVLGKIAATLDYLSGGRFVLGIGIGWLREEFGSLGVPWERRARRTREYIEAIRELWRGERSSYRGEFVRFENVRSYPKPVQAARLPIFIGGQSDAALRRVAEYGNGWCGFNLNPEDAGAKIEKIRELLKANGRRAEEVEFAVAPPTSATSKDLEAYRDAGVAELYVTAIFGSSPKNERDLVKLLEEMAREWVEPAAKLQ